MWEGEGLKIRLDCFFFGLSFLECLISFLFSWCNSRLPMWDNERHLKNVNTTWIIRNEVKGNSCTYTGSTPIDFQNRVPSYLFMSPNFALGINSETPFTWELHFYNGYFFLKSWAQFIKTFSFKLVQSEHTSLLSPGLNGWNSWSSHK